MKRLITIGALLASSMLLSSCCVTTTEFEKYKEETRVELEQAKTNFAVLFCESKVDAYEDMMNTDEPDPTRRDEPDGTRRDLAACEEEFGRVVGAHIKACSIEQVRCTDGENSPYTGQQCRSCYVKCLNDGSWPTSGTPSCPQ